MELNLPRQIKSRIYIKKILEYYLNRKWLNFFRFLSMPFFFVWGFKTRNIRGASSTNVFAPDGSVIQG